jgi:hypothetical protein
MQNQIAKKDDLWAFEALAIGFKKLVYEPTINTWNESKIQQLTIKDDNKYNDSFESNNPTSINTRITN